MDERDLVTFRRSVTAMIDELGKFTQYLKLCAVKQPNEILRSAHQGGMPGETCRKIHEFQIRNEENVNEVNLFIKESLIPRLEDVRNRIQDVIDN